MIGQLILWLTLALPLLIGVGFRVSVHHVFFSLMAGELLGRYFGHDVDVLLHLFGADGFGEALLIVVPMLLTGFFLRFGMSRKRLFIHLFPLALMGVICAAFILPVLPAFLQEGVRTEQIGRAILDLNRVIVGGLVLIQLVALWLMNRKGSAHHS